MTSVNMQSIEMLAVQSYEIDATKRSGLPEPVTATTERVRPRLAERPVGLVCFPILALALWVLTHSYQGIVGDASVYLGRALADLDPTGVGRDMMFIHDGQSQFSIVPFIFDHLVAAFGTNAAAMLFAFVAMAIWVAALAAFASRYVEWPYVAIAVIFVALLPTEYGDPLRFHFAQALAVPRPLSEALILAALTWLVAGRTLTGFAFLLAASLVHPLMALAGWAVFALVLSYEDRRWRVAFAGAVVAALLGAAAGLPVLHRLFTVMNPDLKAFAEFRSAHLFPSLWSAGFWGAASGQVASLIIAASFYADRRRSILIAAVIAGFGGVLAQVIFADYASLLLVIQAQLWRMAWLPAALGGVAFALCALKLWRGGTHDRLVLALVTLAYLSRNAPECAGLFAGLAVAIHFFGRGLSLPVTRAAVIILWSLAALVATGICIHYAMGYITFMEQLPPRAMRAIRYFWAQQYIVAPMLAATVALALTRSRFGGAVLPLVAAASLVTAFLFCDDRDAFQKTVDAGRPPAEIARAIDGRPGPVLWIDGLAEAWYLTGRPQWASPEQGVSTIFSAELAREWRHRMQFLIAERLADKNAIAPVDLPASADLARVSRANVRTLCTRPDAPAWIIAPEGPDIIIPPGLAAHEWRLPQPRFLMTEEQPGSYGWREIDAYAILACAGAVARH